MNDGGVFFLIGKKDSPIVLFFMFCNENAESIILKNQPFENK